ncbi:MAG: hypothetical protein IT340_23540 [Chloroflexi bacterium]|nr:hypothetical protein [Chloroflexota bacterium]
MSRVTGVQIEDGLAIVTLEDATSVSQVAIPLTELAGTSAGEARAIVRQYARVTLPPADPPAVVALRALLLGQTIS